MLNQCVLTGNLEDDPASHYAPEWLAITHFNIAFKLSAKKEEAQLDQGQLLREAGWDHLVSSPQGRQDRRGGGPGSKQMDHVSATF